MVRWNKTNIVKKYYMYITLTQLRFTRVINILFIIQILGKNIVEFSFLQSVFLISQLLMEIPSGVLADILKKKLVLLFGLFLLGLSPLLIILSVPFSKNVNYMFIFIAFVFEGIGNAFLSGTDDALFFECLKNCNLEEQYVKIRGNIQLISSIALGIATLAGSSIYAINIYIPYVLQTLAICVGGYLIITLPSVEKQKSIESKHTLKSIVNAFQSMLKDFSILFVFIFTIIIVSLINAIFTLLPEYVSHLGFTAYELGILFMLYSLVGGVVATQSYRLSKVSFFNIILLFSCVSIISLILQSRSSLLYLIGMCFMYVLVDFLDPIIMGILQLWVKDSARATFISSLSFSINLATIIINPVIGMVVFYDGTKKMTEFVTSMIIVFTGVLYIILRIKFSHRNKKVK